MNVMGPKEKKKINFKLYEQNSNQLRGPCGMFAKKNIKTTLFKKKKISEPLLYCATISLYIKYFNILNMIFLSFKYTLARPKNIIMGHRFFMRGMIV